MARAIRSALTAGCLAVLVPVARAHGPWIGPGADNIMRPLTGLFNRNWNFSATAKCRTDSPHSGEWLDWEMPVAARNGQLRAEFDPSAVKGEPPLSAEELQRQRTMKIARTVAILRPDLPTDLCLYPDFESYVETPRSAEEIQRSKARRTVKRRDLRQELIDNVPCVKRQFIASIDDEVTSAEFTIWEAVQLPHFLYQVRFVTDDGIVTIRFRNVRFMPPDANLFEPPAGARRFDSTVELQRAAGTLHPPAN